MSNVKTEAVTLLAEVEQKLEELLRATPAQDHRRINRLVHLLTKTRGIRQAWDTRWVRIHKLLSAFEARERRVSKGVKARRVQLRRIP
jgi:hypothetical protein